MVIWLFSLALSDARLAYWEGTGRAVGQPTIAAMVREDELAHRAFGVPERMIELWARALGGGWLENLPDAVRNAIRERMSPVSFPAGAAIFHQGDEADALYEVISGEVVISHIAVDGRETIITVFGPGDCLGEQGLIDGGKRENSAHARGEVSLRRLAKAHFNALRAQYPIIAEHLLQLVSLRFRLVLRLLEEASSSPLRLRILRRLAVLAESNAADGGGGLAIRTTLSQSDLGKWVGYSRQSVNAELQRLKRDGYLDSIDGKIIIADRTLLLRAMSEEALAARETD
ncbi:Crp/Fnr family transcriptional regulator [Pacificimonas sp. WHA3]|uniref:Crp/Fnr family transcriptional regulator n=1 Tax=Pacificimonas pallii TaxID=2827236 RepID=A0ABS6SG44_9SPHN|nr:Crp/Fnr family transcriptional regulator [Pacificimonas pallii]MBV7257379.1 Crp/Fnr family transcriptional regulator [Pacificimonas pallii]